MRNSKKNTKIALLVLLVIAILIMAIAFSAMSSTLNIKGTGKVDVEDWDIRFESLERAVIQGTAEETVSPTIKNNTTIEEYAVILKASGDSVTYNFNVHNYGAMNAEISELNFPERPICTGLATNNEQKIKDAELVQGNLSYTFKYTDTGENVKIGDSLLAGESKALTLSIGYYGDELPSEKVSISGLGITMTYSLASTITPTPDEGPEVILMAGSSNSANTAYLNGPITRENIETIKIARKDEKPTNPKGSWDISASQDGSIKAYYTQGSSGKYDVIICAENGRIKANDNSSYLFSNMTNLKQLDLSALTSSETTNVNYMCMNCTNLETVIIGDRMKKVGQYSFRGCTKLKNATIGEDVVEIEYGAFNECKALQTVEMGDNIERIGGFAFNNCEKLQRIHYSSSLKEIGRAAFQYCYALQNIDLPEGLETIGQFAFNHNQSLICSTIRIPSTVKVIGNYYYPTHMFYDCGQDNGAFVAFEVPETSEYYKAVDGILYTKDGKTLVSIPRAKTFEDNTYIMPDEVEILGELCFNRNKNISKVVISDNLIIHDNATQEQINAGYLNYGNSLAIGIYMYTNVRYYEVKDTNTRYTTGNRVIAETKEYGDTTNGGYLLTADKSTLVAVPAKCVGYQMMPSSVTTIRKNALYIFRSLAEESSNSAFRITDSIYNGIHFRIHANTVNIEEQQLKYINWLAKDTTNRSVMHLEIQGTNSKYQIVDNQYVTK